MRTSIDRHGMPAPWGNREVSRPAVTTPAAGTASCGSPRRNVGLRQRRMPCTSFDQVVTRFPARHAQARTDDLHVLNRPPVAVQLVFVLPTRGLFEPLSLAHLLIWRFNRFCDHVVAKGSVSAVADAQSMAQLRADAFWGLPNTIPENAKTKAEMQTVRIMSKPSRSECLTKKGMGMMTLTIHHAKQKPLLSCDLGFPFWKFPLLALGGQWRRLQHISYRRQRWRLSDFAAASANGPNCSRRSLESFQTGEAIRREGMLAAGGAKRT